MVFVRNRPQVLTVPSARHIQDAQARIRLAFDGLWDAIQPDVDGAEDKWPPPGTSLDGHVIRMNGSEHARERALAIAHLEEACMRAIRATTRRADNAEPAVEAAAEPAPASIDAALQRITDAPAVD